MTEAASAVLVVAPQPFYEDRGTPIAVRQLLQALSQLGYETDLLTFPMGQSIVIPRVAVHRIANPLGFRHVPVGLSWRKLALDAVLLPALHRRLGARRYHCVHAVEEAVFPALALAGPRRVPVIYDMQSSLPEQLARRWPLGTRPAQRVLAACERWALRRARCVAASSGLAARVRAAAPGADVREWRFAAPLPEPDAAQRGRLRAELGIASEVPVIAYSGTFEAYQGLASLLAAIPLVTAMHPDAVFILIGADGDDEARLLRGGVSDRHVKVIARQPRRRSLELLAAADVLVSPRAYGDNVPLKIFDYLAAEKPIVATDIAAHRALLDERRALLVPAGDLASGLLAVLADPARAARLAAAGRAYAEEHFGWLGFVRSVGELYDAVA